MSEQVPLEEAGLNASAGGAGQPDRPQTRQLTDDQRRAALFTLRDQLSPGPSLVDDLLADRRADAAAEHAAAPMRATLHAELRDLHPVQASWRLEQGDNNFLNYRDADSDAIDADNLETVLELAQSEWALHADHDRVEALTAPHLRMQVTKQDDGQWVGEMSVSSWVRWKLDDALESDIASATSLLTDDGEPWAGA